MNDRIGNLGEMERLRIRGGSYTGPTSGLAPGNVQANPTPDIPTLFRIEIGSRLNG